MGEYGYHKEDPKIISEESDYEVKEETDMTIEYDTNEEYVIVEKPINNENYEENSSSTGKGII